MDAEQHPVGHANHFPGIGPGAAAIPAPRISPAPCAVPSPSAIPAQRPAPDESHPGIRDAARSAVLHEHARLTTKGRPVFCTPSRQEIAGVVALRQGRGTDGKVILALRQGRGTDGKVIYDTREAAEAAARALEALGARALRSYLCGRSRSGHFHLTTDTAHRPLTPAEVHARIPRQRGPLSA